MGLIKCVLCLSFLHASSLSGSRWIFSTLTPEITKSDLNDLISILHDNNNISFSIIYSQFIFSSYNLIFFLVTYVTPMVYMAFCYVKMGIKASYYCFRVIIILINSRKKSLERHHSWRDHRQYDKVSEKQEKDCQDVHSDHHGLWHLLASLPRLLSLLLSQPRDHEVTINIIVKPKSEVPKSKVPKSRLKGLGLTQ